jgi:starch synthase (maltosyl-transferring)
LPIATATTSTATTADDGAAPGEAQPPRRIVIALPQPAVDGGRYPAKRCTGDRVTVSADIFGDGHELLRAVVCFRGPGDEQWQERQLLRIDQHLGGVRWAADIEVDRLGRWEYTIRAWTDTFGTWRDELERKLLAGQHDLQGELSEGQVLLERAHANAKPRSAQRRLIAHALDTLKDTEMPESAKHDAVLGPELFATVEQLQERRGEVTLERPLTIEVDRERARFGSWYELFPRSWGGLKGVQKQLPKLAELGFDVLYLPPIHPIGLTNRKGANNALTAASGDPGSPWAIGDSTGGHEAVHPDLGTTEDVRKLAKAARKHGIDIALDFAIQCSADHPWLQRF